MSTSFVVKLEKIWSVVFLSHITCILENFFTGLFVVKLWQLQFYSGLGTVKTEAYVAIIEHPFVEILEIYIGGDSRHANLIKKRNMYHGSSFGMLGCDLIIGPLRLWKLTLLSNMDRIFVPVKIIIFCLGAWLNLIQAVSFDIIGKLLCRRRIEFRNTILYTCVSVCVFTYIVVMYFVRLLI